MFIFSFSLSLFRHVSLLLPPRLTLFPYLSSQRPIISLALGEGEGRGDRSSGGKEAGETRHRVGVRQGRGGEGGEGRGEGMGWEGRGEGTNSGKGREGGGWQGQLRAIKPTTLDLPITRPCLCLPIHSPHLPIPVI